MADVTLKALLLGDDFSASRALKGVQREIDQVVERLVVLSRMDATPEVKVRTAEAQAQLAKLQAEMAALGTTTEDTGKRTEHTSHQIGALATALVAVGPAIVPIAAGAVGLAAGFGAMGAAGLLAIGGIKREMAAGTATGNAYSRSVDVLQGNLHQLEATAANGVLKPFQGAVTDLQGRMPALNREINEFSTMAGRSGAAIATGLVAGFVALEPLMSAVSVDVVQLSQRFQAMMTGPGLVTFGNYAQSVLPEVVGLIDSLATTAAHLVTAFAPMGLGVVSELRVLSDILGAIPTDVLTVLATGATSVFIGFRAWQGLSALIGPVSKALDAVKVSEEGVAIAGRAMNAAFGVVGVAIAAFSLVTAHSAEATREHTQRVDDLTEAFKQSHGAISQLIIDTQYKALQDAGALDAAKRLGVGLNDVTQAALGNAPALSAVVAQIDAMTAANIAEAHASPQVSAARLKQNDDLRLVKQTLIGANAEVNNGRQGYLDYKAAMTGATTATKTSTLALQNQTTASEADKRAIQQLNTAIDALLGKNLSLAQAQTNVDQATLNLTATLKRNKAAMNQHTQAGIEDRQALESTASALLQQRDAQIKSGTSVADATRKYHDNSDALLGQIGRLYGTKSAAYAYAKQLLAIPKSVTSTITANTGQAVTRVQGILNMLAAIHNKSVDVTVNYLNNANRVPVLGPGHNADGTASWRGGLTWVGERGPELMDLPKGTRIWSHTQSTQMIANSAGSRSAGVGGGGDINLTVNLRAPGGHLIQQELLKYKRDIGGTLGLA